MNLLIIQDGPDALGGIQTLIVRFCEWLVESDHEPVVLVRSASTWGGMLPVGAKLVESGELLDLAYIPWRGASVRRRLGLSKPDAVFHFEFHTAMISYCLFGREEEPPRAVVGNFMPHFDFSDSHRLSGIMWRRFVRYYSEALDPSQRMFMSKPQLENLKSAFGEAIDGRVIPLPVDLRRYRNVGPNRSAKNLVTLCRLDPMKAYLIPLVEAIGRLRERGHEMTLEIFGDGELRGMIEESIRSLGASDWVFLRGSVEYGTLPEVFSSACAFVGMGTSLVEAAASGVPSIVALAHDSSGRTPGFFSECREVDLGDPVAGLTLVSFEEKIAELLEMDASGRESLSLSMRERAAQYDMASVFPAWMNLSAGAGPISKSTFLGYQIGLVKTVMALRGKLKRWF